jgi:hypothetical protein
MVVQVFIHVSHLKFTLNITPFPDQANSRGAQGASSLALTDGCSSQFASRTQGNDIGSKLAALDENRTSLAGTPYALTDDEYAKAKLDILTSRFK